MDEKKEGLVDSFSNRLNKAMVVRDIKASALSEKTGISKSSISEYLSGKYEAKQNGIYLLAKALNVSEAWLMGCDVPMEREIDNSLLKKIGAIPLSQNPNIVKIPILGTVKAGYDYLAQENIIGNIDVETSLVGDGSEYFALRVKGDSMSPIFIEGDTVIIRKQNDCENNEIAIVIVNGDEGTIKKVRKTEQGIILQPLNPAYAPMIFTNEEINSLPITIIGIVKQLKREF